MQKYQRILHSIKIAFIYTRPPCFNFRSDHRDTDRSLQLNNISYVLETDTHDLLHDLHRYRILKYVTEDELESNIQLLLDHGLKPSTIVDYIHILRIPNLSLRNSLQICEECGCSKSKLAPTIMNFTKVFQCRFPILKAYGIFPATVEFDDIVQKILGYLDVPKEEHHNLNVDYSMRLKDVYNAIFTWYVYQKLPVLGKEINTDISKLRNKRYTSMQNFRKNVTFLMSVLKLNTEELIKYKSLLFVDSDNMTTLLQSQHGINIRELCHEHPDLPHILKQKFDKVHNIVKSYNINFTVFMKHPKIFRMNSTQFEYHFMNVMNSPFLSVFKNHPQLPLLIERGRTANERLQILKHFKMNCYNMRILTGKHETFLKYVANGINKVNSKDTFLFLSNELQKPLAEVESEMNKNTFVNSVSIAVVSKNLKFLQTLGFKNEEIFRSIQILLYPKDLVKDKIMKVHLGDLCIYKTVKKVTIKKEFYLPLALYYIEKDYNFSGSVMFKNNIEKIEDVGNDSVSII